MTADRWAGLWHGGVNYAAPDIRDAELFPSLAAAADAVRDRRDMGHHWPQQFRYAFRAAESALTPCAHDDQSGGMLLYRLADGDASELLYCSDPYPDRSLTIGPRGGIRIDRC